MAHDPIYREFLRRTDPFVEEIEQEQLLGRVRMTAFEHRDLKDRLYASIGFQGPVPIQLAKIHDLLMNLQEAAHAEERKRSGGVIILDEDA